MTAGVPVPELHTMYLNVLAGRPEGRALWNGRTVSGPTRHPRWTHGVWCYAWHSAACPRECAPAGGWHSAVPLPDAPPSYLVSEQLLSPDPAAGFPVPGYVQGCPAAPDVTELRARLLLLAEAADLVELAHVYPDRRSAAVRSHPRSERHGQRACPLARRDPPSRPPTRTVTPSGRPGQGRKSRRDRMRVGVINCTTAAVKAPSGRPSVARPDRSEGGAVSARRGRIR